MGELFETSMLMERLFFLLVYIFILGEAYTTSLILYLIPGE